ncbi:MAG: hypothetical protein IKR69_04755 [Bacteroidales bacterium]|nr:hypothetical protein [Bacteroidales bacterium]
MKKIFAILLVSVVLAFQAGAQSVSRTFPDARIDRDPVTAGLAGAGTSMASAYASWNNAAAAALMDEKLLTGVSYQLWQPSGLLNSNISLGGALRLGKRYAITAGATLEFGPKIPAFTDSGIPDGYLQNNQQHYNFGAAIKVYESENVGSFSIGANGHYLREPLTPRSRNWAWAVDGYLQYRRKALGVALGIQTLGGSYEYGSSLNKSNTPYNDSKLPTVIKLAADYTFVLGQDHSILTALDLNLERNWTFGFAGGVQYAFRDMVFARVGYNLGARTAAWPSYLSVGLGGKYKGFRLDAAYIATSNLRNSFTVGFGYSF